MGVVPVDRPIWCVIRWHDQSGGVMHALGIYLLAFGVCGMLVVPSAWACDFMHEDNAWPMFFLCAASGAVGALLL